MAPLISFFWNSTIHFCCTLQELSCEHLFSTSLLCLWAMLCKVFLLLSCLTTLQTIETMILRINRNHEKKCLQIFHRSRAAGAQHSPDAANDGGRAEVIISAASGCCRGFPPCWRLTAPGRRSTAQSRCCPTGCTCTGSAKSAEWWASLAKKIQPVSHVY